MKRKRTAKVQSSFLPELFQPNPDVLYSLDAAAHLAGVPRRSILLYCQAGLVQPLFQPPYGVMSFTEESIHTVRQIEHFRAIRNSDVDWIKAMLNLLDEVERLRTEVRFLRNR